MWGGGGVWHRDRYDVGIEQIVDGDSSFYSLCSVYINTQDMYP